MRNEFRKPAKTHEIPFQSASIRVYPWFSYLSSKRHSQTMNKVLCLITTLVTGILPLLGQDNPTGQAKREAGRSAWFVYTDMPEGVENPVKILADKGISELKLEKYMASEPVKIPVDGILRIVREGPNSTNPGKPNHLILAEAKIPENVREALIILMPLPKPEGDRLFLAKIQDLASFKGGDRLYINLSDTDISVQLGPDTVSVPSKHAKIYSAPKLAASTSVPIMYQFYHPEKKEWKLLTASTIVLRPTRRQIDIFNNGTRLGTIKKYGILFPVPVAKP
jgi:hypothetical protein